MNADIITISSDSLNLIWLILFVVLLVIELFTVGLTTIWFAIGSLAAFLADLLGAGLPLQIVIFLAVSCILLIFTRPWAARHVNRRRIRTNYESEIGKIILITEKVDNLNQTGKSTVDGQEWTVRSRNDEDILEPGDKARVVDISGVKLIVEKYKEDSV